MLGQWLNDILWKVKIGQLGGTNGWVPGQADQLAFERGLPFTLDSEGVACKIRLAWQEETVSLVTSTLFACRSQTCWQHTMLCGTKFGGKKGLAAGRFRASLKLKLTLLMSTTNSGNIVQLCRVDSVIAGCS